MEVGPAGRAASRPRSKPEDVTDAAESAEKILKVLNPDLLTAESTGLAPKTLKASRSGDPTDLVVLLALLGVGQRGVRLGDFFELFLGFGVTRVGIGVILRCQLSVGLLYLLGRGLISHAKGLVEILLDPVSVHSFTSSTTSAALITFPLSR